jgi:hypothetical protein
LIRKILVFSVLLVLAVSVLASTQLVSALEVRTVFDNRHSSASFGDSKVCGDHLCGLGEKPQWTRATWGSQHLNSSKLPVAPHGEDIMSELAKAPMNAGSMHQNKKMSHK